MSASKLRASTAVDKALGITAVGAALKTALKDNMKNNDGDQIQAGRTAQDVPSKAELTDESVGMYLQGISASSCSEIDALITDLCRLRDKLVSDGDRIEKRIVEFARLNQSVVKLVAVVSDRVAQAPAPGTAGL